jgi:hypothetical protein
MSFAAALGLAVAVARGVHVADGQVLHLGVLTAQVLADLGCAPAWALAPELTDRLLDL